MGFFSRKKKKDSRSTGDKPVAFDSEKEKDAKEKKTGMKELYESEAIGVKKEAGKEKDAQKKKSTDRAYKILIKPLITEKAANLGAENKYLFEVDLKANKIEIIKAIDELYGLKPTAVNIIRMSGKNVRYGRIKGRRKNWKKAIVTLPKGATINIYEGV